jgi:hypothetical protein
VTSEPAALGSLDILALTLVGGLALFLVYSLWQATCVAWMRQLCFEARDAVFDLAAEGRLQFSSAEYREIRSGIETLIRFAERISWPRLLCYYLTIRPRRQQSSISRAIEKVSDPETQAAVRNEIHKVNSAVWMLLIARSPVLIVVFALFAVVRWMTTEADRVRRGVLETIKIEAEEGEDLVDHTSRGSFSWLRAA